MFMFAEDEVLTVVEKCVMVDMVEVSVVVEETSDVVEVGVHVDESVLFFFLYNSYTGYSGQIKFTAGILIANIA